MVGSELFAGGLATVCETAATAEPDMTVKALTIRASKNGIRLIKCLSVENSWRAEGTLTSVCFRRPIPDI
jgi:hypothetical protein